MTSGIHNHPFVSTPSGQAVLDDSTYLVREWVANRAIGSGLRALAHESYAQDPSQTSIRLGADEARIVYALACQAATIADLDPIYKGALSAEGLPVGADALAQYSKPGASDLSLGNYWLKPTGYAVAMTLSFEDAPASKSVPVMLSPSFRQTMLKLLQADAQGALAKNPALASKAQIAADRAESEFLSGGRQLRHGGYFPTPARKKSDLSAAELTALAQNRQAAQIAVAFGFGEVFGRNAAHRHGAGWDKFC